MTIQASILLDQLVRHGVNHFVGVPCSFLGPLIDAVIDRADTRYIVASSEGDAVAIACGLWFNGITAAVLCQNSGLGNMLNPLSSVVEPFGIPVLMLVSWRGHPGVPDEPQHRTMGRITPALLDLLGIAWERLPEAGTAVEASVARALAHVGSATTPFALVVAHDSFAAALSARPAPARAPRLSRWEALRAIIDAIPADGLVVATTGMTGRELYALGDRPTHLYCVGGMGYANALAHGIALGCARDVYVLDGDGAALMHLGNLSTIGHTRPANLTHIVLDNGSHDSTGGQPTASGSCDFPALALAAGYASALSVDCGEALRCALQDRTAKLPRLLHLRIRPGSRPGTGRPDASPHEVARRLRRAVLAKDSP
jgi:phosphonopyruvate decarboxylase